MKKHLVTYGDSKYTGMKEFFKKLALASSFFDHIHVFSDLDLDPVFYKNIYEPIKSCRGGGYWIWKPYFIKKIMDLIDEDDVLIYCDAGSTINGKGVKRFDEYMEMASSSATGTVDFNLYLYWEYEYTKQEVFNYFNASEEIINSNQLFAGILILRKCAHTVRLVDKWYEVAVKHPFLFTDEKIIPQHPGFIDHRHDQSIFSIIRKTYGTNLIEDETYFDDFAIGGRDYPLWATQIKPKPGNF